MKQQDGFTLIEVLIAVVILATGMVIVLEGMRTAIGAFDSAVDKTRASFLVQSRFDAIRQSALSSDDISDLTSDGEFEEPFAQYRWDVTVEQTTTAQGSESVSEDKSGKLYEVDVTVWRFGSERKYSASTLVYIPPEKEAWTVGADK